MNAFMYGLGILAISYFSGQLAGEWMGVWFGVKANVGGVGFAMILLILLKNQLEKRGLLKEPMERGIDYWNQMYVPVVIAMSASQNVRVAVSSGLLAVLCGLVPTVLAFAFFPLLLKNRKAA